MAVTENTFATENPARLPAAQLESTIAARAGALARGTRELLVLVGELDARHLYLRWGALSCAAWLAEVCDLDIATARTWVRVARAMRAHPALATAMGEGHLSYAKARVLVPYLATIHDRPDIDVPALIDLAASTPAAQLGATIATWSHHHEDHKTIDQRHHQQRTATWRTDPDAMVTITTRLPPLHAARITAAIDQQVMSDRAPAGASLAQQRADALVHLMSEDGSSVTTEIVVHVDENGCHLPDGTPLTEHPVTATIDHALISLLIHDTKRQPIDASPRRRQPTRRQRQVTNAHQPECATEGCSARTLLQYDHIQPYATGGTTTLDNLQRLCGPHNREKGG